jgi:hypothetical protein
MMVYTCYPSCSRVRDKEDCSFLRRQEKPKKQKTLLRPYLQKQAGCGGMYLQSKVSRSKGIGRRINIQC